LRKIGLLKTDIVAKTVAIVTKSKNCSESYIFLIVFYSFKSAQLISRNHGRSDEDLPRFSAYIAVAVTLWSYQE
jgi:hypothetical protein